jgi:hypothetical protein
MCHLWAVPYTGSGMNPARVFGAAVVSHNFHFAVHWAYWLGPLLGASFAALSYDFLFAVNATPAKLRGFFSRAYEDKLYDASGRVSANNHNEGELSLKERA